MGDKASRERKSPVPGCGLPRKVVLLFLPAGLLMALRRGFRWWGAAGAALALAVWCLWGLPAGGLLGVKGPLGASGLLAAGDPLCGRPGAADGRRYGRVHEQDLPWFVEPPARLEELRAAAGAHRLLSAFRVSFPDPLFEETHNIVAGARYLAGTVLRPGAVVSVNAILGPYTADRGYREGPSYAGGRLVPSLGGGVCKVSSALYNAAVLADLAVVERHPHSMPVPYVPPGRDAAIAWRAKDLRLRVDGPAPVVVWAAVEGDTLYVALYGGYDPPRVEWHQEELARAPFPTIRRLNPQLPPGQERVVVAGADGVTVRTAITVTYPGAPPQRRDLGVDAYRPLPRLVEHGPQAGSPPLRAAALTARPPNFNGSSTVFP